MYDITTIGIIAIDTFLDIADIKYRQAGDAAEGYYCLPVGSKIPILNLVECLGGNALNAAVGFKRLELNTAIITSLGTSQRCKDIIQYLKRERISTKHIIITKDADVNLSYILDWHKHKSDRVILTYCQLKNFKKIRWPKTKWLYITSLNRFHKEIVKQLPEKIKIAYTPGGYEIREGVQFILPVLRRTNVLIVNLCEAVQIVGVHAQTKQIEFIIHHLLQLGPDLVVVTDGSNGAYGKAKNDNAVSFEKTIDVPVKEVTGAGDAFASGFLTAYIKNLSLEVCLRWGILNSTACISHIGAHNGLLTYKGINKQYKRLYKKS